MQAQVKGSTMPVLEVVLDPGEAVVSDHGELSWMTANMQMAQTTSAGAEPGGHGGLMAGLKRVVGGGSILLTRYEATGGPGMVAFAAKVPGHIVALDVAPGQGYLVARHSWICGTPGVVPSMGFQQSLGGMLFGGEGFVLQRLEGQGTAWVELSGELTTYDLAAGQSLLVHPGHVGVFSEQVSFGVSRIAGIANRYAGGDGHWVVKVTGPGKVWLQSMPLANLAAALQPLLGGASGASDAVAGGAVGAALGNILRG
ncbi:MAG: AIM24 family protein [Actinomycetota bacterium]|nr:AIM24 family protein [Actinomycetota bacterium]